MQPATRRPGKLGTAADSNEDRDPLLLPCCRLLHGRLLLVLITDLVKPDIDDISIEFRPRRHREAQSLLDIDELDMGLAWRNGDRNPLEFGHDGIALRTLAHHRITQGDLDLSRPAHRSEYDAALHADLDDHGGAVHRAFAGSLAERKLVAQVAVGSRSRRRDRRFRARR